MPKKVRAERMKVPVSPRALVQRINRKLAGDGEVLKKTRGYRGEISNRALLDLGEYFVVDLSSNFLVDKDVDLKDFGRKLGVLAEWETLVAD